MSEYSLNSAEGKKWIPWFTRIFDDGLTVPMAEVLHELGVRAAFVFHSEDGLDELTTTAINHVAHFDNGVIRQFDLDARELGLPRASREDLRGGGPAENGEITRAILGGEQGARRDVVLLNSAAGLVVGGRAADLPEGLQQAAEAIDSGRALTVLSNLTRLTQDMHRDT